MISSLFATASDPRVAFEIGSLTVRWYGLIIVIAMLLGLFYVCLNAKKINLSTDDGVELFLWVIPLAVIFARILYVFPGRIDEYFPWRSWDDFVNAIAIWDGGITIIGGLLGGAIGVILFSVRHRKQTTFLNVADLIVVPLLTGQIIGRLGNFINQEAFGLPILDKRFQCFPFGVYITEPSGVSPEFQGIVSANTPGWFCATFFYEMVWNFIGLVACFIFWQKGKNKKYPGLMIIFYFFWYFLGRVWLEQLRLDAVPVTTVACAVIIPISFLLGVLYVIYRNSKLSYKRVRALAEEGRLEGQAFTAFDIKNYAFVGKLYGTSQPSDAEGKKRNDPLAMLYGKEEYIPADFGAISYYSVPKRYLARFAKLKRTEIYSAKQERI